MEEEEGILRGEGEGREEEGIRVSFTIPVDNGINTLKFNEFICGRFVEMQRKTMQSPVENFG